MVVDQRITQLESEAGPGPACCHHWIIETANGPVSRGVCRYCLVSREFKNSVFEHEQDSNDLHLHPKPVAGKANGAEGVS